MRHWGQALGLLCAIPTPVALACPQLSPVPASPWFLNVPPRIQRCRPSSRSPSPGAELPRRAPAMAPMSKGLSDPQPCCPTAGHLHQPQGGTHNLGINAILQPHFSGTKAMKGTHRGGMQKRRPSSSSKMSPEAAEMPWGGEGHWAGEGCVVGLGTWRRLPCFMLPAAS